MSFDQPTTLIGPNFDDYIKYSYVGLCCGPSNTTLDLRSVTFIDVPAVTIAGSGNLVQMTSLSDVLIKFRFLRADDGTVIHSVGNTVVGTDGADRIDARNSVDTLSFGGLGDDTMWGAGTLYGGEGNDDISQAELVFGGNGDDQIRAELGYGEDGNDVLYGGSVYGGSGDDFLYGGPCMAGMAMTYCTEATSMAAMGSTP